MNTPHQTREYGELHSPILLIITGDPATGKPTLAKHCEQELGIAVLSRDTIKELMFDSLGWFDREWSKRVGSASFELMFYFLGILMDTESSVILDCNLSSECARKKLRSLLSGRCYKVVEVVCSADREVTIDRFRLRSETGGRHPGHVDGDNLEEFQGIIGNHPLTPAIPGSKLLIVDTGISSEADVTRQVLDTVRGVNRSSPLSQNWERGRG